MQGLAYRRLIQGGLWMTVVFIYSFCHFSVRKRMSVGGQARETLQGFRRELLLGASL